MLILVVMLRVISIYPLLRVYSCVHSLEVWRRSRAAFLYNNLSVRCRGLGRIHIAHCLFTYQIAVGYNFTAKTSASEYRIVSFFVVLLYPPAISSFLQFYDHDQCFLSFFSFVSVCSGIFSSSLSSTSCFFLFVVIFSVVFHFFLMLMLL